MMLIPILLTALLAQAATAPAVDVVVNQAVVAAPPSAVWEAFTTRAGIESWMVATGDVDLKVGGLMRTSYQKGADLDGDTAIHQSILSIDPERMLSFRTIKSPKGFAFADLIRNTWTVIYFEGVDGGRTRVTARMFGYSADAEFQKMRAFFERGNAATLASLTKRFEAR